MKITTDQENQTKKLIKHLGLSWEKRTITAEEQT